MTFPIIQLSGSSFQQGVQQGQQLKEPIGQNLEIYFDRFLREAHLERAEVLERAAKMLEVIKRLNLEYYDGMRGISEGSGFSLLEIAALNVRYEILYYQFGEVALEEHGLAPRERVLDGCTAFAVMPEASSTNQLMIGQNWDWIPDVKGAILHTKHDDGLETLAFTEAGIFGGKLGLNSNGVGLCINGMTSMDDDWSRAVRPVHVRCYEILKSRDFKNAVKIVTDEARACSVNLLVAQAPNMAVDLEAAPNGVRQVSCSLGSMAHTNHFLAPNEMGVIEPPSERRDNSRHRQKRMTQLLESKRPLALEDLQTFLRDRDGGADGICRYPNMDDPPEEHYVTVTAVIMNLETREMWITDGQPDVNPFVHVKLEKR